MNQKTTRLIPQGEAYRKVLSNPLVLGTQRVPLEKALHRYLAEPVLADRDLPPYHRATMDGIALAFAAFENGKRLFPRAGMARAGVAQQELLNTEHCLEIATGAVLPKGADTVVRYEDLENTGSGFQITAEIKKGQNIHRKGSDATGGSRLLDAGLRLGPAEISVLASVGLEDPLVHSLPRVTLVSSGDELVDIHQTPEPHQVRKSNIHMLRGALVLFGIEASLLHLPDRADVVENRLEKALHTSDVLMLSGGVSRGRYDFIPGALERLGVEKVFHRVAQRPGKPFWFGKDRERESIVFSFPGNPVSTFLSYHLYFRDWLYSCWGLDLPKPSAVLASPMTNPTSLTQFHPVQLQNREGTLRALPVPMNGSGDFVSLPRGEAFVRLEPKDSPYSAGTAVPLVPYKTRFL